MNIKKLTFQDQNYRKEILNHLIGRPYGEEYLMAFLLSRQNEFQPFCSYPYVFKYKYPFDPFDSREGEIDLILTSGRKYFLIVEAKFFQEGIAKSTIKSKRRRLREQIVRNKKKYQLLNPQFIVESTTLTNDNSYTNEHPEFLVKFNEYHEKRKNSWKKDH